MSTGSNDQQRQQEDQAIVEQIGELSDKGFRYLASGFHDEEQFESLGDRGQAAAALVKMARDEGRVGQLRRELTRARLFE